MTNCTQFDLGEFSCVEISQIKPHSHMGMPKSKHPFKLAVFKISSETSNLRHNLMHTPIFSNNKPILTVTNKYKQQILFNKDYKKNLLKKLT